MLLEAGREIGDLQRRTMSVVMSVVKSGYDNGTVMQVTLLTSGEIFDIYGKITVVRGFFSAIHQGAKNRNAVKMGQAGLDNLSLFIDQRAIGIIPNYRKI